MEDIFVVKRCNKIIIHGRRAGEPSHLPPEAEVWYRIVDTRTQGFFGDGFGREEEAVCECLRLNTQSQVSTRQA